jgi:tetratricopeptide (TPR) repeat protein
MERSTITELVQEANRKKQESRYEDAIATYSKVLVVQPTQYHVLYSRAFCYYHMKQYNLALSDLLAVTNMSPAMLEVRLYSA